MSRRRLILEAFKKRLDHYGYDKTTMAEIAADVGISVGTLYQEFDSKEDILGGLVEETAREFDATFRAIAESSRTAAEKLKEVLVARVVLSDRCCRESTHSGEVLLAGVQRCGRARAAREARYLALLEQLLVEGIEAGEFEASDPARGARILRDAISAYLPPESLAHPSAEVLVRARELGEVLVRGLRPGLERVVREGI